MILITSLQDKKLFYFWNWTKSTLTKYSTHTFTINGLHTGMQFKNVNITTDPQHHTELK